VYFVNSVLKILCYIVKNTLLQTAFSILPNGLEKIFLKEGSPSPWRKSELSGNWSVVKSFYSKFLPLSKTTRVFFMRSEYRVKNTTDYLLLVMIGTNFGVTVGTFFYGYLG